MKTDRELLELAAKAAGYKVRWHDVWQCLVHELPINTDNPPTFAGQRLVWIPLQDDGDALRLAVRLGLIVEPGQAWVSKYGPMYGEDVLQGVNAATRRAITRAAAQMQLNKEQKSG